MTTKLKLKQKVKCQRETPPKGSWKHYNGKKGVVKVLPTKEVNEYGVQLDGSQSTTWFAPDELVPL